MDRYDIFEWVKERYGTLPEYLWDSLPDGAVLRNKSGKWYAVIMYVRRERLGLTGEGKTDVLDLKCDPLLIGSLLTRRGFLPAYHMNKNHWISILLDGSVPDGEIMDLIRMSYNMTVK